jgi:hypothetical protein
VTASYRSHCGHESIPSQGAETSHRAAQHHVGWTRTEPFRIAAYGNERRVQLPRSRLTKIRCLNNIVEQDHRRVEVPLAPMIGLKSFYNARRVIIGIELAQKIHKRQFAIPANFGSHSNRDLASLDGSLAGRRGAASLDGDVSALLSAPKPIWGSGADSRRKSATMTGWGTQNGTQPTVRREMVRRRSHPSLPSLVLSLQAQLPRSGSDSR